MLKLSPYRSASAANYVSGDAELFRVESVTLILSVIIHLPVWWLLFSKTATPWVKLFVLYLYTIFITLTLDFYHLTEVYSNVFALCFAPLFFS
jgi:hypothetical protein